MRNQAGLRPGIDVRGDGGYVVAPPSLHASGNYYRWAEGRAPQQLEPAPIPRWLLQALTGARGRTGHPVSHWRSLAEAGVRQGERNTTIASFTGHLLWHGVDPDVVRALMLSWNAARCRPPLSEDEVNQVVDSIVRLHEQEAE